MMKLKDKTNMPVSELGKLGGVPVENILSLEKHFAARRRIQAAEEMKQRALSCARRTDNRNQPCRVRPSRFRSSKTTTCEAGVL